MFDINSYADYGTADWATTDALAEAHSHFVVLQSDGQFALATTPADPTVFGVLRDNLLVGEAPAVRTHDITYVYAGEALSVGDYVTNDANGEAVVATSGQIILGQVIDKGVAAGEEAKINMFNQPSRTVA